MPSIPKLDSGLVVISVSYASYTSFVCARIAFGVFLPLFNKSCVRLFISVPEMAEEGVVIAIAEELAWIGILD